MQLFAKSRRRRALTFATGFGLLLLVAAQFLASWQPPQVAYYNRGVELYTSGDVNGALSAFDKSLAAYRDAQHRNWLEGAFMSAPSTEVAALAYAHEGLLLAQQQKPEQAVAAFQESLALNPGHSYAGKSTANAQRLHREAVDVKYKLDLLLKQNPSLAQKLWPAPADPAPTDQPRPNNDTPPDPD